MIRRHIAESLSRALTDTPVVLISGARQTGKTTLVQSVAALRGARYFTLDDAATLSLAGGDPAAFVRNLSGPVVLDEVQKLPALFPAIKLAVDQRREPGRFLLTGSANVMTVPHVSESLAGRMEILPLFPFSAGELAHVEEDFLARLFDGTIGSAAVPAPTDSAEARIIRGGYPGAVARTMPDRRAAWFASYLSTILQRDVRELARIDHLHTLPNLMALLAARSSGLLNVADVARDAGLPHTTVTRHLVLLETLFLIHRLPAWAPNLGQRLVKATKLHLVDTGLACHLLGVDDARLRLDRALMGRLLESFVVGELRKQVSWTSPRLSMCHYRTAAGSEVDVVLEAPDGQVAAVEVKASMSVGASDFVSLAALRDRLGVRFRTGVVLYLGERVLPAGDQLWLVPLAALWAGKAARG